MVSIKQAVENAAAFAQDILGESSTLGLRLEEVESRDDAWLVTLSLDAFRGVIPPIGAKRSYKVSTVDKHTGEVTSMKIRELANA